MITIPCTGIDAGFANMGFAHVLVDVEGSQVVNIRCESLHLVCTSIVEDRKAVRKSSTELRRCKELLDAAEEACRGKRFAFAEVPGGSQNAGAARGFGAAVCVLAAVQVPLIEVSPQEVKDVVNPGARGKGSMPSKPEMIRWAHARWPAANWILHGKSGKTFKKGDLQNCNEHLADALVTAVAGVRTPEFQRLLAMMANTTTGRTSSKPFTPPVPLRRRAKFP